MKAQKQIEAELLVLGQSIVKGLLSSGTRMTYKVEVQPAIESSVPQATARNEDGSTFCHVPLSPLVLQAMRGRKVAYFQGEQFYHIDAGIADVVGKVVLDLDAEVEGQTW